MSQLSQESSKSNKDGNKRGHCGLLLYGSRNQNRLTHTHSHTVSMHRRWQDKHYAYMAKRNVGRFLGSNVQD